jgi:hypothetical protein
VLGTAESGKDENGELLPMPHSDARTQIEMNAAAVRMLGERYPDLKIKYPQTVVSEKTVMTGGQKQYFTETRTDAVIQAPDSFVQVHTGAAFRQLLTEEWNEQLSKLTEQIVKRLRRHELRTARMFGGNPDAAAVHFRVTEDTAESDIWTVQLSHCGFYPLQWDGEICGMALLLAEKLKEAALSITEGLDCINSGLDFVAEAVKTLEHYAMAEKVLSFLDDFEKLTVELEILKDNYERGEKD